jgi:hypothetical protein
MTIHALRIQFNNSFWDVFKDLVKLEALDEHSIPPGDVTRDIGEHITAHRAMLATVAYHTSPQRTRVLPRVKV